MPSGKNNTGKDKNTPKRKTISPLSSDNTRGKTQGGKTGFSKGQNNTRTTQTQVSKQQKRFHTTTGQFNFHCDKVSDAFPISNIASNMPTGGNMAGIASNIPTGGNMAGVTSASKLWSSVHAISAIPSQFTPHSTLMFHLMLHPHLLGQLRSWRISN